MHGFLDQAAFDCFKESFGQSSLVASNRNKLELDYAKRREFVMSSKMCHGTKVQERSQTLGPEWNQKLKKISSFLISAPVYSSATSFSSPSSFFSPSLSFPLSLFPSPPTSLPPHGFLCFLRSHEETTCCMSRYLQSLINVLLVST